MSHLPDGFSGEEGGPPRTAPQITCAEAKYTISLREIRF